MRRRSSASELSIRSIHRSSCFSITVQLFTYEQSSLGIALRMALSQHFCHIRRAVGELGGWAGELVADGDEQVG